MKGRLFSEHFLNEEIKHTNAWKSLLENDNEFASFQLQLKDRIENVRSNHPNANESTTNTLLIHPTLKALGWSNYLEETHSGYGIPDHLLFLNENSMNLAAKAKVQDIAGAFRFAAVVHESKKFNTTLGYSLKADSPHAQILDYLRIADSQTDGKLRWGMLTNGQMWRLYDRKSTPTLDAFYEIDIAKALQESDIDVLKNFFLLFQKQSFEPKEGERRYFLEDAIEYGRRYEEHVTKQLAEKIYENVFPRIINLIALKSKAPLSECRDNALVLLYRLLFVLFAEDRGFLPIADQAYQGYSLRTIRDEIAEKIDFAVWPTKLTKYYDQVLSLFRLINEGDDELGVPPYNGGLFAEERAPLLKTAKLPDADFAPSIFELSHIRDQNGRTQYISYRDLSVQQLGSIYERLLEKEPIFFNDGTVGIQHNPYVRQESGSYYTPQELVDLVLEHTLTPLINDRRNTFCEMVDTVVNSGCSEASRLTQLQKVDPACAVLNLKILDPAVGSGHFLVSAVDVLTEQISTLMSFPANLDNDWLSTHYQSPLVQRIETTRNDILTRAQARSWAISESQLSDKTIISRMVLKKCIYGVDKNELAVELAKVSLWLHTFTVGTPLSFLDHHLRNGDSLVGMTWNSFIQEYKRLASGSWFGVSVNQLEQETSALMNKIESMADSDIDEVHQSSNLFQAIEQMNLPLYRMYDMLCGWRWKTAGMKNSEKKHFEKELVTAIDNTTDPNFLGQDPNTLPKLDPQLQSKWNEVLSIAKRESFFHWELSFPGVWKNVSEESREGGFDAVIGNPPWDVSKVLEVKWFALREPTIAQMQSARRKQVIRELKKANDPLITSFEVAKSQNHDFNNFVKKHAEYPLLSSGDFNLYGLFVERSLSLINSSGVVGLVTQSGIFSDYPAAKFFKLHSTSGRIGAIFDFENRRMGSSKGKFFPDIDGRVRICVMITGGKYRKFKQTKCGFLLHSPEQIQDDERCVTLSPDDFVTVSPNTGTAPIFLNRREARIVTQIYRDYPILVNRACNPIFRVYAIRYHRMFDSSNDSHLFKVAEELESDGYFPIKLKRWQKGTDIFYPLYQARTIHQYDHRHCSIGFNPDNLHRPHFSVTTSESQHQNSKFLVKPHQYVSSEDAIQKSGGILKEMDYVLGCRRITSSTNQRTVISAIVPKAGYVDSMWLLLPLVERDSTKEFAICQYKDALPFLVSIFNSFLCEFLVRRKFQGTALNWYIMEQLPVIPKTAYQDHFGPKTAADIIKDTVLELTYTSIDMEPFARDLGYDCAPYVWKAERRRQLKARLDALYFHLYGVSVEDAKYVLDTFPIVEKHDIKEFGYYRTKKMILAHMNALSSGDSLTMVDV